jgi:shikimate kinase
MKKIILCGYMGSGKTTIARLLSVAAEIPYLDLDHIIEKEAGKSIKDIFEQDGEIKFRKMEHVALKNLLSIEDDFILGLGGGTPCYANNHEFLQREDVVSVYLKASITELLKRIREHGGSRPLLDSLNEVEKEEYVAQHLFERSYYYHFAKHVVTTDNKTPENIVNEIMSLF